MKSDSLKNKIKIITLIAACIAFFVADFSLIKKLDKARENLYAAKSELASVQERAKSLSVLKSDLEKWRKQSEGFTRIFLDRKTLADFLGALERNGDSVGLEIKMEYARDAKEGDVDVLQAQFSAVGSFDSLHRMTEILENMPAVLHITGVSYAYNESDKTWRGEFSFTVTGYDK